MNRRKWTAEEDAELARRYPSETAKAIAESLSRGERAIYQRAIALGLSKPAGWMAECTRQRWVDGCHEASRQVHFKKGQTPHNKGRPAAEWIRNMDAVKRTQFKKGRPASEAHHYRPIGSLRVLDGQLQRKVTDDPSIYPTRRWVPVARLVWEASNGPIPQGHVVRFLAGRQTTVESEITLDRLELVSRRENMLRNSRHTNYPPELNQVIQLVGALNRKINNRSRKHEEQDAGRA